MYLQERLGIPLRGDFSKQFHGGTLLLAKDDLVFGESLAADRNVADEWLHNDECAV